MHAHSTTEAPLSNTRLKVSGMTCGNCARKVTGAALTVAGVRSFDVNLDAQVATVRWEGATVDVPGLTKAIEAEGYQVEVLGQAGTEEPQDTGSGWRSGLILGVSCTVPMILGEWVFGLGGETWFKWLSLVLAGVVQVLAGGRFYRGAWAQLRVWNSNMDTLVALGSTTAFGYSTWALLAGWPGHVYFMEAAAIITLVSVGHWMEARVSAKAAGSLRALVSLMPQTACRRDSDGNEQEVPVAELAKDDLVVLRPGDVVPTDGTVKEGASSVDESMLTGESLPVDKALGNELYAGTANVNGRLIMRVTATGEATALAHIIDAVRRAQTSTTSIQRLGDRVSSVFVPVVLVVALAAALWWGLAYAQALRVHGWLADRLWPMPVPETGLAAAFIIAAAVLIIACPCAMGLATPAAIMAAANVAARRGILIRDGVALEKAGAITCVVFDKTGTLTTGRPVVAATEVIASQRLDQWRDQEIRSVAASVARHSLHPFSEAVAALTQSEVPIREWRELRGAGLLAKVMVQGREVTVRLGSLRWLRKACSPSDAGGEFLERWSALGASVIALGFDEQLVAMFAIQDELKPGAPGVVRHLEHQGARVYLVTGDHTSTAQSLAHQAGIERSRVHAEARPEEKAALVQDLQAKGERVAFIGDGINDAPALEQAHLGVAVSRASDIAREAADVVLLNTEIEAVPEILVLARATLRTIKQNLFWAFFYNAAAIPLAALGFLSPILCAIAMGGSDLVVIGNALRLRGGAGRR